jgi:hypothetical protein
MNLEGGNLGQDGGDLWDIGAAQRVDGDRRQCVLSSQPGTRFGRPESALSVRDASDQDYRNHVNGVGIQLNLFDNLRSLVIWDPGCPAFHRVPICGQRALVTLASCASPIVES